jgi:hypothetical protein
MNTQHNMIFYDSVWEVKIQIDDKDEQKIQHIRLVTPKAREQAIRIKYPKHLVRGGSRCKKRDIIKTLDSTKNP